MAEARARPRGEDFAFRHATRVRWSEVDPQGIVFNPRYFAYFDLAVTEYWRALGLPYPDGFLKLGVDTFAKVARAEYHAPARYDDLIDIACRCVRLGRTSLTCAFAVWREDELLVDGEIVYVCADPATRRPVPVPEPLRAAILRLERLPPEGA